MQTIWVVFDSGRGPYAYLGPDYVSEGDEVLVPPTIVSRAPEWVDVVEVGGEWGGGMQEMILGWRGEEREEEIDEVEGEPAVSEELALDVAGAAALVGAAAAGGAREEQQHEEDAGAIWMTLAYEEERRRRERQRQERQRQRRR